MAQFIFTYSILLILLCSIALSMTFLVYIKNRKPIYMLFSCVFLCCIAELAELHFYAFFPTISDYRDSAYIDFLGWKIFICFCFLFTEFRILLSILQKKWSFSYLLFFIPFLTASLFFGLQSKSGTSVWLFYSLRQFYRLGYCISCLVSFLLEQDVQKKERLKQFSFPIAGYLFLTCCILLEDGFMLSVIDYQTFSSPYLVERNFSENILWIFLSLYMIVKCISTLKNETSSQLVSAASMDFPEDGNFTTPNMDDENITTGNTSASEAAMTAEHTNMAETVMPKSTLQKCLPQWKEIYMLTPREVQILGLLFYKGNEEICDELSISPATLKKHLHNIYYKTGANSRTELFWKLNPMN